MGRPRTPEIAEVKRRLVARLREGFHRPGDRFLSNRAIAEQFSISYQTADRLVRELVIEGLLDRRPASGTYLPGQRKALSGVQLIFHPRAKRKASFGSRLLRELRQRLTRERIDWRMSWSHEHKPAALSATRYPVVWESPVVVATAERAGRAALLLNQKPAAGLGAVLLDSVSVDDFSGGACAAQLLVRNLSRSASRAIVSGPRDDPRSAARVAGFLSVTPATVIASPSWFLEGGLAVAARAVTAGAGGIFCCNDRLAEAIIRWCREHDAAVPPLVGFDDAPVADWLNLTTMALPWNELASAALSVIQRRLAGDHSTAITQMVSTRPVIRAST